jgi:hypothetical protein
VGDVSVIHPGSATVCSAAAKTDSGAAALRDADKITSEVRSGLLPACAPHIGDLQPPWSSLHGLAYRRVVPGYPAQQRQLHA